ncbi:MAG: TolC family protein, partial [Solirubrobacterales bacterium]
MKSAGEARSTREKPLPFLSGVPTWRTMPFGLLAATLTALLAGCEAPEVDVSGTAARLRASVTKRVTSPAPRSPETLTVDRAIAEALAASPQLDQMASRVAAAAEQVKIAEAGFYPRLVLLNDYARTDNPMYAMMDLVNQRRLEPTTNFNDLGTQSNFSTLLQAQWSVFDGGRTYYNRQAAAGQELGAKAALAAERN